MVSHAARGSAGNSEAPSDKTQPEVNVLVFSLHGCLFKRKLFTLRGGAAGEMAQ